MGLILHIDGGSRGNPGPAGAGVVLRQAGGELIHEAAYFLGRQTNNAAEYHALIRGLERARQCDPQPITIYSDSELLVRQVTGEYEVKSANLSPLHRQVQMLLLRIGGWSLQHLRREENRRADELANLAMDRRRNVIVFDIDTGATGLEEPTPSDSSVAAAEPQRAEPDAAHTPPAVRVTVTHGPEAGGCPAGGFAQLAFTIHATLPAGLCIHAAHALTPTVLAILNTDPAELAAVPTLTVRCARPGCRAEFQLSPVRSPNGNTRT